MMIKQYLYIILIAILLYACAGESKDESNRSAAPTESIKKTEDIGGGTIFTELEKDSEKLTSEQLEALQTRAIQKFQDFTDYIKIISAPNVDDKLKEHSVQLVFDLFINDTIAIPNISNNIDSSRLETTHLRGYINSLLTSNKSKVFVSVNSIKFINPLKIDSTNSYTGIMESSFRVNGVKKTMNIDVHLVEVEKSFGDNNQTIMEVRLGKIY